MGPPGVCDTLSCLWPASLRHLEHTCLCSQGFLAAHPARHASDPALPSGGHTSQHVWGVSAWPISTLAHGRTPCHTPGVCGQCLRRLQCPVSGRAVGHPGEVATSLGSAVLGGLWRAVWASNQRRATGRPGGREGRWPSRPVSRDSSGSCMPAVPGCPHRCLLRPSLGRGCTVASPGSCSPQSPFPEAPSTAAASQCVTVGLPLAASGATRLPA